MPAIKHEIKAMGDIIDDLSRKHDRARVFQDWVELMALAYNIFEPDDERHKAITKQYKADEYEQIKQLYHYLVDLMAKQPKDWLGQLYMDLAIESKSSGQYFTPPALGMITSHIIQSDADITATIQQNGLFEIYEPSCGSGALLINYVERIKKLGFDPSFQLLINAQDLDIKSIHMAFIQISLLGVPAVFTWGDTLTQENRKQYKTLFWYQTQEPRRFLEKFNLTF